MFRRLHFHEWLKAISLEWAPDGRMGWVCSLCYVMMQHYEALTLLLDFLDSRAVNQVNDYCL
jgi:hypothetical protein